MTLTRLHSPEHPLAGEWWALYESAFPASERRGAEQHAAAMQDAAFHCLHLADAQGFVGLLCYWQWDKLCYVEHLAIVPGRRGLGLGHLALQHVPAPTVLEIEPVVDEQTARRLRFYESCAKGGKATISQNPFTDVAENAFYYNPVLWAVENKITTGTGDGTTFAPNEDCTRGQVITFLYRAYTK